MPSPELSARSASARLATATDRNVSVVGQPLAGKSDLAVETLEAAAATGRDVLFISAERSATRLGVPETVSVIDCTPGPSPRAEVSVNSPADLTGISMPVSRFLADADDPVIAVDSISSLLLYAGEQEVFRFLSVISTQLSRVGGLGLFTVNDGAHDETTVRTFAQLFDGQIQLRDSPGGTEARGNGIESFPPEWVSTHR